VYILQGHKCRLQSFSNGNFVVVRFLLTSVLRSPSEIAELLVIYNAVTLIYGINFEFEMCFMFVRVLD